MRVEIITPDKELYKGRGHQRDRARVDGSMGFLNGHALIAVLKAGDVKLLHRRRCEQVFPVKGGVVEVSDNTVLVLAGDLNPSERAWNGVLRGAVRFSRPRKKMLVGSASFHRNIAIRSTWEPPAPTCSPSARTSWPPWPRPWGIRRGSPSFSAC